ncbi:MAG: hypothetical protein K1X47_18355, partial [Cyclobacteriaceae bacterium]|nr:hypothetical protein [Cyclobacteriaceae bacterium]
MIKTGRDIRWAYAVTVLLLFVFLNAEAQESRRQYRKAKEFFDDKQYALAMESFRPLIAYDRNNPYSEYASFYYALSAYYQHFPAVAKDMLRQCAQLYPNWNQQSQVAYWLATLYFEEREYFQALRIVPAGSNSDPLVAQLKLHHLKDIQDTELLRMMLEEFPTDEIVAQVLAIRLHDEGSPFAMREAVELVERMGLHIEGMESDPS